MASKDCLAPLVHLVIRDLWVAMVLMESQENQAQEVRLDAMVRQVYKV